MYRHLAHALAEQAKTLIMAAIHKNGDSWTQHTSDNDVGTQHQCETTYHGDAAGLSRKRVDHLKETFHFGEYVSRHWRFCRKSHGGDLDSRGAGC